MVEVLDRRNLAEFYAHGISGGAGAGGQARGDALVGQGFAGRTPPTSGIGIEPPAAPGVGALGVNNPGLTLGSFLPVSGATGLPTGGNIVDFPVLPSGSFAGLSTAAIAFRIVGG